MEKIRNEFNIWSNDDFKGCYKHLKNINYERITLSYGIYNRENNNLKPCIKTENNIDYFKQYKEGWVLGVNLRIVCNNGNNNIIVKEILNNFTNLVIPFQNRRNYGLDFFCIAELKIKESEMKNIFGKDVSSYLTKQNLLKSNNKSAITSSNDLLNWINLKLNCLETKYELNKCK